MFRKFGILASLFVVLALTLCSVQEAQAKRFGGGSSFGSRPSYSEPFQHSTSPSPMSQPMRSPAQQQAAAQNQTARQNMVGRGGLMGMLGGLALGGLLGSLLFGGAFENFNFMDILIFAGIAFLLYKLFVARKAPQSQPVGNAYGRSAYGETSNNHGAYPGAASVSNGQAGFDTDILNKTKNSVNQYSIPANFDQQGFIQGAERAFRHLQVAWDNRDLASIRGLTTDKVFAEIQEQLRTSNHENKTEVLQLKSQLMEVREVGSELEATVLFESLMREDNSQEEIVREVWHFIKPVNSQQPKWFLDGIQQLVD